MSALDRQAAIGAALIAALAEDAQLTASVGSRIYDAPPSRSQMPAVTLRLVSALDVSSADTEAQNLLFDLDVWDRYELGAGVARPRAVMARIRTLLHMRALAAPGISVLTSRCTAARGPFVDPDEVTLHGVVSVAVLAGHESFLS